MVVTQKKTVVLGAQSWETVGVNSSSVDFAAVVWREEGSWMASPLPAAKATSLETLVPMLRQQPGEGGTFGVVAVNDEFFLVVRVLPVELQFFISDLAAALDWELAQELADEISAEDEDIDDGGPAGDLDIFADFGLDADELEIMVGDSELSPYDMVKAVAKKVGFGSQIKSAIKA